MIIIHSEVRVDPFPDHDKGKVTLPPIEPEE